jgi:uncharacterized protein (DUF433 family)
VCRPEAGIPVVFQATHQYDIGGVENLMTTNLEQVERLLGNLSRAEKSQLVKWIISELSDWTPGIETQTDVCGGEPCIVRTRIPVWLLEQARRLGSTEAELLIAYPTLRAEDLANTWAYVRSHSEEIERQIHENEAS